MFVSLSVVVLHPSLFFKFDILLYVFFQSCVTFCQLVTRDTVVVIEYPVELGCLPHAIGDNTMIGLRNRRYGRTVLGVWVFLPSGQYQDMMDSRPEEFVSIKKK